MKKLFGTDGIRGIANDKLTAPFVTELGLAVGTYFNHKKGAKPLFIMGRDTRLSGTMLESAMSAGLNSVGVDVIKLGVLPTPAISFLVKDMGADAGIMLTASHNPYMYNGIKIFGSNGMKITDEEEDIITKMVYSDEGTYDYAKTADIGTVKYMPEMVKRYTDHISLAVASLEGLRIAVDCANGAASSTARAIFEGKGAEVTYIAEEPDGTNINKDCGSLFINKLGEFVAKGGYDLGVAFDGDADRCLAVDENGQLIDGDMIVAVLAKRFTEEGKLKNNAFAVTIMSNMGLFKFAEAQNIKCHTTKVGDRYVLEAMLREGLSLGGEQSGHTIIMDKMCTGDGELTALMFAETVSMSGKKASEVKSIMKLYPQVQINIHASEEMKARLSDSEVKSFLDLESQRLMGNGRIMARASGTEPLIRVMAEGLDKEVIEKYAKECADTLMVMLK